MGQIREDSLARQLRLCIVPKGTRPTEPPADLAAWDSLPEGNRRLFARQAEVFARMWGWTTSLPVVADIGIGRDATRVTDAIRNVVVELK